MSPGEKYSADNLQSEETKSKGFTNTLKAPAKKQSNLQFMALGKLKSREQAITKNREAREMFKKTLITAGKIPTERKKSAPDKQTVKRRNSSQNAPTI